MPFTQSEPILPTVVDLKWSAGNWLQQVNPTHINLLGFPGGSVVKNSPAKQEMQETWVRSLGQEDPLEEEMATYSSIFAGKSHGQRTLVGYSPWGCKESDVTECTHTHTHTPQASTPCRELPGGPVVRAPLPLQRTRVQPLVTDQGPACRMVKTKQKSPQTTVSCH